MCVGELGIYADKISSICYHAMTSAWFVLKLLLRSRHLNFHTNYTMSWRFVLKFAKNRIWLRLLWRVQWNNSLLVGINGIVKYWKDVFLMLLTACFFILLWCTKFGNHDISIIKGWLLRYHVFVSWAIFQSYAHYIVCIVLRIHFSCYHCWQIVVSKLLMNECKLFWETGRMYFIRILSGLSHDTWIIIILENNFDRSFETNSVVCSVISFHTIQLVMLFKVTSSTFALVEEIKTIDLDRMAAILKTSFFSNAFCWMKSFKLCSKFQCWRSNWQWISISW